jgi:GTP-binding protein
VNTELQAYRRGLAERPQVVAVNKVDLPEVRQRIPAIRGALKGVPGPVAFISAATGEGVPELLGRLVKELGALPPKEQPPLGEGQVITPPRLRGRPTEVVRAGPHAFAVRWPRAERLAARVTPGDFEATAQLMQALRRLGVARALDAQGAEVGDTIRIGGAEFRWPG